VNGDGKIEEQLGLGTDDINSFDQIYEAEEVLSQAKKNFDNVQYLTYENFHEQILKRGTLEETPNLVLVDNPAPSNVLQYLNFKTLLEEMNRAIQSEGSHSEKWEISSTDTNQCQTGSNDDGLTFTGEHIFNPIECKPYYRDWIQSLDSTDAQKTQIQGRAKILTDTLLLVDRAKVDQTGVEPPTAPNDFLGNLNQLKLIYGRYIIQYSSSSLFIDNTALEDIYYIASKYKIDSLRFTYQKTNGDIIGNSNYRKEYSKKDYRIHYGKCDYNSYFFEYGYLGNRIVRSSIIAKTLGKNSPMILNAYKNLWTDAWWNQIGNIIDTTYASIYRDVFLYFESKNNEIISSLDQNKELTIREFIYFWIFTYETLPRNNNKKELILEMKSFTDPKNMVKGKKVTLNYLKSYFDEYEYLLRNLIKDEYISDDDKQFVTGLLSDYEKIKK